MPRVDAIEESEAGGSVAAPGTSQMLPCDPNPLVLLKKELADEQFPASHGAPCSNSGCVSDVLLPSNSLKSHGVNRETGSDSGHGSPAQHSPASRSTDEEPAATPAGNSCLLASVKAEVDFDDFKSDSDSECELSSDQEDSNCDSNLHADDELPFEDDFGELTSLAWLRDTNLLRNLAGDRVQQKHQKQALGCEKSATSVPAVADLKSSLSGEAVGCSALSQSSHTTAGGATQQPAGWFRGSRKPPYSFSCLIFMAIEQSPNRCLPVNAIYDWISRNFPYYQTAPTGWKNSVRHNLSLNKCFRKLDRESHRQRNGKGACWCVDPLYRPNLVQALQRTPYYGNQQPMQLLYLSGNVSRATAGPTAGAASTTICYDAQALPHGVDMEAANALVSLRTPSVKRELSPDFVSHKDDDGSSSPSDICHEFSSAPPALKRQQCCDNEVDFLDVRSLPPDVVTDAPSTDHTYTAAPPSTAERRSTTQQQSLLTSSSSSEGFRLAAENELVPRDGVPSCDDGSDAASSSADGEEQELCNNTVLTAITSPAGTVSQNPASDRCLRGKMALQAFARATTIGSVGRSNRWASSRLRSAAAAAAGSPAQGRGCSSSSSSLLRLASAASLAMMDDQLTRSGPSSR